MKLRSDLKIERLVDKALPSAKPFREAGYTELTNRYNVAARAWERYRDTICMATVNGSGCQCETSPLLVNHPLRTNFKSLVDQVNAADRKAYAIFDEKRKELGRMYKRTNELRKDYRRKTKMCQADLDF